MTERTFDLICFDVDGTLIEHPDGLVIWEVLNQRYIGNRRINRKRLEMFQSGEISYDEWVKLDVEGWVAAGATRDDVYDAVSEFELIEGAYETVHELMALAIDDKNVRVGMVASIQTFSDKLVSNP